MTGLHSVGAAGTIEKSIQDDKSREAMDFSPDSIGFGCKTCEFWV
jgi:hypothetical protein